MAHGPNKMLSLQVTGCADRRGLGMFDRSSAVASQWNQETASSLIFHVPSLDGGGVVRYHFGERNRKLLASRLPLSTTA